MEEPPPPSDPELREALGISDDVTIHRVDLEGEGSSRFIRPDTVVIAPGDLVQFVARDHRPHLVRFPQAGLPGQLLEFLRRTAQDSPPPLVERGARLVLTFDGAPEGRYPFLVEGDGGSAGGEIRVERP